MHLPRRNRGTWLIAGILVLAAIVVAGYAVHELSKPGNSLNPKATFVPPKAPTHKISPKTNDFVWAVYGYTQQRTRDFSAAADLNPPFKQAWALGGNALLEFPPVIWGNNMYYLDDGATAKRVNITTGKLIWEQHVGLLSASTPALDVKTKELFVSVLSTTGSTIGSTNGEFAALSMITGKLIWKVSVPSGTESSPIVVGDSVYFGDQDGTLYSLNIATGHENWSLSTGGSIKAGPAYYHGDLFFGNYGGSFYSVDASTGKVVWSKSIGGEFYSTPAIAFGRVYVGNNAGDAYSFVASSGTEAWSRDLGGYVYSGPAVADIAGLGPTVFVGSYDGYLYALNAQDGSTRWDSPLDGGGGHNAVSGSATIVGNTVYVSTVYHTGSFGFNAVSGKQVFSFPDGSYTTVIADPNAVFLMGKYVIYKLVPKA